MPRACTCSRAWDRARRARGTCTGRRAGDRGRADGCGYRGNGCGDHGDGQSRFGIRAGCELDRKRRPLPCLVAVRPRSRPDTRTRTRTRSRHDTRTGTRDHTGSRTCARTGIDTGPRALHCIAAGPCGLHALGIQACCPSAGSRSEPGPDGVRARPDARVHVPRPSAGGDLPGARVTNNAIDNGRIEPFPRH
jgi:hypothetical protein